MKARFVICILSFFVVAFTGCGMKETVSTPKKAITGSPGEVLIVTENSIWQGKIDSTFTKLLGQTQIGLPQPEPLFDVTTLPPVAFTGVFKTFRNIILVYVGDDVRQPKILFIRDKFAKSQSIVSISSANKEELTGLIELNGDSIINFFNKSELDRYVEGFSKKNNNPLLANIKEHFGVEISIPYYFSLAKSTDDFFWARFETPESSQGIFIYSTPMPTGGFSLDYYLNQRNIVLRKNVPGSVRGSYMSTESKFPINMKWEKTCGNEFAELRGLWKVENDFMGGPFVAHSFADEKNKRFIMIEGYVYAPAKRKRNLLREVEAIVCSIRF